MHIRGIKSIYCISSNFGLILFSSTLGGSPQGLHSQSTTSRLHTLHPSATIFTLSLHWRGPNSLNLASLEFLPQKHLTCYPSDILIHHFLHACFSQKELPTTSSLKSPALSFPRCLFPISPLSWALLFIDQITCPNPHVISLRGQCFQKKKKNKQTTVLHYF